MLAGNHNSKFLFPEEFSQGLQQGFVFLSRNQTNISSVIRQKGESQNGCFKKAKHPKISEKQTFLTP